MYRQNQISEYLHRKAMKARIPLSGTFELTPVCNMDCRMCYVRMSPAQQQAIRPLRTTEEWLELARVCRDQGMVFLLLTGGEPFLRPDFIPLLTEINRMGIITSVNTNGTLITQAIVEDIVHAGPTKMNITLYGASDETYSRLCGNPKGYTQTTRAIELLRAAGIEVKVNMSITPYNIGDMEQMIAWCRERELNIQCSTYMFPPYRKEGEKDPVSHRLTPDQAARAAVLSEFYEFGPELFQKKYSAGDFPVPAEEECLLPAEGTGVRCRAGGCTFWVTWEGILMPCGIMPKESGINVFDHGMDKAWDFAKAYTDAIRMPAKCAACQAVDKCHTCAAMCISETGAYDIAPSYRCDMFRAYGPAISACLQAIKQGE